MIADYNRIAFVRFIAGRCYGQKGGIGSQEQYSRIDVSKEYTCSNRCLGNCEKELYELKSIVKNLKPEGGHMDEV